MATSNARQAVWVSIGSFFSFLVGIISPMILSRYFDKTDYGTYKQVMYVYTTLLSVFTLGLPRAYAYFIPKGTPGQAKDVISKITTLFAALGLCFSCLLFIFSDIIAEILKNPELGYALKIFSPVPLLMLPTLGLDGIFASFQKTQFLAVYTIITKILTVICIVVPVIFMNGDYIAAIIGFDVASLLTCILALVLKNVPIRRHSRERSEFTYRHILNFAIPLAFASLWGMIIGSSNQFFISRYFGTQVFADYSNGFMDIPFVGMIVGSIAVVLQPLFSRLERAEGGMDQIIATWRSSLIKSAMLVFPMLIYGMFVSVVLMTTMYGDAYSGSGKYFVLRCIYSMFAIVPYAPVFLALGHTKAYARAHMLTAIGLVIAQIAVVHLLPFAVAVPVAYVAFSILNVWILLNFIKKYLGVRLCDLIPVRNILHITGLSVVSGILMLIVLSPLRIKGLPYLALGCVAFIVFYFLLSGLTKLSYKELLKSILPARLGQLLVRFIP